MLIFFPRAVCPQSPIDAQAAIMGTAMLGLKPPFLVDRAGISETGIFQI